MNENPALFAESMSNCLTKFMSLPHYELFDTTQLVVKQRKADDIFKRIKSITDNV